MIGDTPSNLESADQVETDPSAVFEEWASEAERKAFAELAVDPSDDTPASP